MKYTVVIALIGALVACSGGSETMDSAENALNNLTEARKMLASVMSVEDAKAIETTLSETGKSYAEAVQLMRSADMTNQDTAKEFAQFAPKMAAEYQGLLHELNALQARNIDASQVLLDELKSFQTKR